MNTLKTIFIIISNLIILCAVKAQSFQGDNYLTKNHVFVVNSDSVQFPRKTIVPDHFKMQFAGNIGFLSVGAGYNFGKAYELTAMVGLLNDFIGNHTKNVVTISAKNQFNITKPIKIYSKFSFVPLAGISVNWGYTNNTFKELPPHYAEKYYFQNKVHLAPFAGGKIRYDINKKIYRYAELYAELGILDIYMLEFIRTDYITLDKVLNLALGVTIYIK